MRAASTRRSANLPACALLLSLLLSCGIAAAQPDTTTANNETDYTLPGAPMPPLLFMAYTDTTAHTDTKPKKRNKKTEMPTGYYTLLPGSAVANNANLLVMIFSPECAHCNATASLLEANAAAFHNSKLLLLTTNVMSEYIPDFAQKHNTNAYKHLYVGYDSSGFIKKTFLYHPLPQINIYSPARKLLKTFSGETPIDSLRPYIE